MGQNFFYKIVSLLYLALKNKRKEETNLLDKKEKEREKNLLFTRQVIFCASIVFSEKLFAGSFFSIIWQSHTECVVDYF